MKLFGVTYLGLIFFILPDITSAQCLQPESKVPNSVFHPVQNDYNVGNEVKYECNVGFILSQENSPIISKCEFRNGKADWTPVHFKCLENDCGPPVAPENGRILWYTGQKSNDTVEYRCNEHATVFGPTVSTCGIENGTLKWSPKPPTCIRTILLLSSTSVSENCKIQHDRTLRVQHENRELHAGDYVLHGDTVEVICKDEDGKSPATDHLSSEKKTTVKCRNGRWSASVNCFPERFTIYFPHLHCNVTEIDAHCRKTDDSEIAPVDEKLQHSCTYISPSSRLKAFYQGKPLVERSPIPHLGNISFRCVNVLTMKIVGVRKTQCIRGNFTESFPECLILSPNNRSSAPPLRLTTSPERIIKFTEVGLIVIEPGTAISITCWFGRNIPHIYFDGDAEIQFQGQTSIGKQKGWTVGFAKASDTAQMKFGCSVPGSEPGGATTQEIDILIADTCVLDEFNLHRLGLEIDPDSRRHVYAVKDVVNIKCSPLAERYSPYQECKESGKWDLAPEIECSDSQFQIISSSQEAEYPCTYFAPSNILLAFYQGEKLLDQSQIPHLGNVTFRCLDVQSMKLYGQRNVRCIGGKFSAEIPNCIPLSHNNASSAPPLWLTIYPKNEIQINEEGLIIIPRDSSIWITCWFSLSQPEIVVDNGVEIELERKTFYGQIKGWTTGFKNISTIKRFKFSCRVPDSANDPALMQTIEILTSDKCVVDETKLRSLGLEINPQTKQHVYIEESKINVKCGTLEYHNGSYLECTNGGKWVAVQELDCPDLKVQQNDVVDIGVNQSCTYISPSLRVQAVFKDKSVSNGSIIPHSGVLFFRCKMVFTMKLFGSKKIQCINGKFATELPHCQDLLANNASSAPPLWMTVYPKKGIQINERGLIVIHRNSRISITCWYSENKPDIYIEGDLEPEIQSEQIYGEEIGWTTTFRKVSNITKFKYSCGVPDSAHGGSLTQELNILVADTCVLDKDKLYRFGFKVDPESARYVYIEEDKVNINCSPLIHRYHPNIDCTTSGRWIFGPEKLCPNPESPIKKARPFIRLNQPCVYVSPSNQLRAFHQGKIIENNSPVPHLETLSFRCTVVLNMKLIGPRKIQCVNGKLSEALPECKALLPNNELSAPPLWLSIHPKKEFQMTEDGMIVIQRGSTISITCWYSQRKPDIHFDGDVKLESQNEQQFGQQSGWTSKFSKITEITQFNFSCGLPDLPSAGALIHKISLLISDSCVIDEDRLHRFGFEVDSNSRRNLYTERDRVNLKCSPLINRYVPYIDCTVGGKWVFGPFQDCPRVNITQSL